MDNPKTRFYLRAALVGVFAAASALQVALPGVSGDDVMQVVVSGLIAALAYAGIGAATPLEPSVGPQPKPVK